ncbi:hypothetical protein [Heyndrickxia acidicola]|uniref:Uncharacterized protein n=1 Tax=Heyndrickxia acidicola TaxID=209389 RepID=A0ABU6MBQ1_9BACI|nr:hypothetical protein [Heyndrickxia acidicola]MED1201849.1 hypothetical protein [Heyndrickxia acidicola]
MKWSVLILALLFCFGNCFQAINADESVPPGAVKVAREQFKPFVLEFINNVDRADFHFTKSKEISFSRLYPVYGFVGKKGKLVTHKPSQWISVVYQDGKPKNVISLAAEKKTYIVEGIGSSNTFPATLSRLKLTLNDTLITEVGDYFLVSHNQVKSLDVPSRLLQYKSMVSVQEFSRLLHERWKRASESVKAEPQKKIPPIYIVAVMSLIGILIVVGRKLMTGRW